jgi:hypothetical protein
MSRHQKAMSFVQLLVITLHKSLVLSTRFVYNNTTFVGGRWQMHSCLMTHTRENLCYICTKKMKQEKKKRRSQADALKKLLYSINKNQLFQYKKKVSTIFEIPIYLIPLK